MSQSKGQTKQFYKFLSRILNRLRKWLVSIGSPFRITRKFIRNLLAYQKRSSTSANGFVLPTVVMVTTVVTLLVAVVISNSSQRAQSAANARVEEAFRSAAFPVLERARAKLEAILANPQLSGTPTDDQISGSVRANPLYTLADEVRLQLFDGAIDGSAPNSVDKDSPIGADAEVQDTAWKFPIDTDGNGKYDSFGIYSILYRDPASAINRVPTPRKISLLESRTPPMAEGQLTGPCAQASSAGAGAGIQGWTQQGSKLRKSFFIFSAVVPLTVPPTGLNPALGPAFDPANYETYNGSLSAAFTELQQDRARFFDNTAVRTEGDLELALSRTFRLNGRVYSSSNAMFGAFPGNPITFYEVSDPNSCVYANREFSAVITAGNLVDGDALTNTNNFEGAIFHLFRKPGVNPLTDKRPNSQLGDTSIPVDVAPGQPSPATDQPGVKRLKGGTPANTASVVEKGEDAAFNEDAYNKRVQLMVEAALNRHGSPFAAIPAVDLPKPILNRLDELYGSTARSLGVTVASYVSGLPVDEIREVFRREYDSYFRDRTRKVPFKEVNFNYVTTPSPDPVFFSPQCGGACTVANVFGAAPNPFPPGDKFELSPPLSWVIPPVTNGAPFTTYTPTEPAGLLQGANGLTLNIASGKPLPRATEPVKINTDNKEEFLGDRVRIGNNLPRFWYTEKGGKQFVGPGAQNFVGFPINNVDWDAFNINEARYRETQAALSLAELRVPADRNGLWEHDAADNPARDSGSTIDSPNRFPTTGGLRVITNAGIYTTSRGQGGRSFLPNPPQAKDNVVTGGTGTSPLALTTEIDESKFKTVWYDSMPMTGAVNWDGSNWRPWDWNAGAWATASTPDADPILPGNQVVVDSMGTLAPNPDNRRGDLQMRATVVYHYRSSTYDQAFPNDYQAPIACVSSYYDNSFRIPDYDPVTAGAQVLDTTSNNPAVGGRSNNGISYPAPSVTASTLTGVPGLNADKLFIVPDTAYDPLSGATLAEKLAAQANLVFPNGRLVNEALRNALIVLQAGQDLSLAQQAAIDSNICALQILNGNLTPNSTVVPNNAIKEVAFVDGRELKSLTRDEQIDRVSATQYDLEIEQRQPLEIRTTELDINILRTTVAPGSINGGTNGVPTDYLLPFSGIVYASREDALEDLSYFNTDTSGNPVPTPVATRRALSATDFKLDPTRKVSGIRLINGERLWRGTNPNYATDKVGEKGLILASNLPVFIKGNFNLHRNSAGPVEEFTNVLNTTPGSIWQNFYVRSAGSNIDANLNPNFARKANDPTCTVPCTLGDEWRPARVIADAVTVQSSNFRDGYRSDGDFDLRNNADTSVDTSTPTTPYNIPMQLNPIAARRLRNGFLNNNFVTSANWQAATNSDGNSSGATADYPRGNRSSFNANGTTPIQRRFQFAEFGMEICRKLPVSECAPTDWVKEGAGTTVLPTATTPINAPRFIAPQDMRYARRVSFVRFDDIYGDGNESILMVKSCDAAQRINVGDDLVDSYREDRTTYPLFVGVANGDSATGYTYPRTIWSINPPFRDNTRFVYGNVPCPEPRQTRLRIETGNLVYFEGGIGDDNRMRTQDNITNANDRRHNGTVRFWQAPPFDTTPGSIDSPRAFRRTIGSRQYRFDERDHNYENWTSPAFNYAPDGNDSTTPFTTFTYRITLENAKPGVKYDFNISTCGYNDSNNFGGNLVSCNSISPTLDQGNEPDPAGIDQDAKAARPTATPLTLNPNTGATTGGGYTGNANYDTQWNATNSTPPPGFNSINQPEDYERINNAQLTFDNTSNPNFADKTWDVTIRVFRDKVCELSRAPIDNNTPPPLPPALNPFSNTNSTAGRPNDFYGGEDFFLAINPNSIVASDGSQASIVRENLVRRGRIQNDDYVSTGGIQAGSAADGDGSCGSGGGTNPPTPVPPTPTPTPTPTPPTPTPTPTPTPPTPPTPTPTPLGSTQYPLYGGLTPLPVGAMMPAAAYPFDRDLTLRFNPPVNGSSTDSVARDNDANSATLTQANSTGSWRFQNVATDVNNLNSNDRYGFPVVPPTSTKSVQNQNNSANTVMLPGMNRTRANDDNQTGADLVSRALWFVAQERDDNNANSGTNFIGSSWGVRYSNDFRRFPFIFNNAAAGSSGRAGVAGKSARPFAPEQLTLPRTACIDSTNPANPRLAPCPSNSFDRTTAPANLITLNVPIENTGSNTDAVKTQNAPFNFLVCGQTGNVQYYMTEKGAMRSGTCPNATSTVVNTAWTRLSGLTPLDDLFDDPAPRTFTRTNGATGTINDQGVIDTPADNAVPANDISPGLQPEPPAGQLNIVRTATRSVNVFKVPTVAIDTLPTAPVIPVAGFPGSEKGCILRNTTITLRGNNDLLENGRRIAPEEQVFVLQVPAPNSCRDATSASSLTNFVPQLPGSTGKAYVFLDGVQIKLENGVNPNNIFWTIPRTGNGGLQILGKTRPSILVGNFLTERGSSATNSTELFIRDNGTDCTASFNGLQFDSANLVPNLGVTPRCVTTRGVRFLGFTVPNVPSGSSDYAENAFVTAMTTTTEPILPPVLQIVNPASGTTGNQNHPQGTTSSGKPANRLGTEWLQQAQDTIVNIYFLAGQTPSRSYVQYGNSDLKPTTPGTVDTNSTRTPGTSSTQRVADSGGGLNNFIRLMEDWGNPGQPNARILQISGGFIQAYRSRFATAPFMTTAPYRQTQNFDNPNDIYGQRSDSTSVFTDPFHVNSPLSNYRTVYQQDTVFGVPYYGAPERLWGYDVALLLQPPDLFALRQTIPAPGVNEFYRDITPSDPYIARDRGLLCAMQPATLTDNTRRGIGVPPEQYTATALPPGLRPDTCANPTYN